MGDVPLLSVIIPWRSRPKPATLMSRIARPAVEQGVEVVVVDDASDEVESSVMELFAKEAGARYLRLPVQHGPGGARNAGLQLAEGLYVNFSDADDQPLISELCSLARQAEHRRADVAIGAYSHEVLGRSGHVERITQVPGEAFFGALADQPAVWRYIFSREFLAQNHLAFPMGFYAEDLRFLLDCYESQPSILTSQVPCYVYVDDMSPGRLTGRGISDDEFAQVLAEVASLSERTTHDAARLRALWEIRIWARWWRESQRQRGTRAVYAYAFGRRASFVLSALGAWHLLWLQARRRPRLRR
jgi:glycosyltransferase involved in cell wall biosynthesis